MKTQDRTTQATVTETIAQLFQMERVTGRDGTSFELFPVGMRSPQGESLCSIAVQEKACRTIETGFAMGISGLFLMKGTLQQSPDSATHCAMDPFEDQRWKDAGVLAFESAGIGDRLSFHNDFSEYVLPQLIKQREQYDMGFVDGDHRFESALGDITLMMRVIKPGGLIVVDDTWMPSVRAAVQYAITNMGITPDLRYGDDPHVWTKTRLFRNRMPKGATSTNMVALRLPLEPARLLWDSFHSFHMGRH